MISKILKYITLTAILAIICGFIALTIWDIDVKQETVEKQLELKKSK